MVGHHHALLYLRLASDRPLNLSQLDAMPAYLYLCISAPQEGHTAIRQINAKVAAAVADIAQSAGKRVDHELFSRERGIPPVTQ